MSRHRSRLSIAIPTRDRPQFLKATLESLDRQTQSGFDIVVADSGQITVEHLLSSFPRLHAQYLRRSNDSPSEENWKAAVEGCESDFVVTLHDDDTVAPRFVEARLAILNEYQPHLVYSNFDLIGDFGEPLPERTMKMDRWSGRNKLTSQLLRPETEAWFDCLMDDGPLKFTPAGLLDRQTVSLDRVAVNTVYDLAVNLYGLSRKLTMYYDATKLVQYRLHSGSITSSKGWHADSMEVIDGFLAEPNLSDRQRNVMVSARRAAELEAFRRNSGPFPRQSVIAGPWKMRKAVLGHFAHQLRGYFG